MSFSGAALRKEAAKEEILAMPETVPALSSEEESKASKKLEELEKEFEEHRGFLVEIQSGLF